MASRIVSGTPVATVDEAPKLDRMSARTTPLWLSTSGPFEPSPGYGPPVSSGIGLQSSTPAPDVPLGLLPAPVVEPDVALEPGGVQPATNRPAPTAPEPSARSTWRRLRRVSTSNA